MVDVDSAAVAAEDELSDERNDAANPNVHCIVIDCSSMLFIDCVGTLTIKQVSLFSAVSTKIITNVLMKFK